MSEPIQAISQGNYILQAPPASSYMNLSGLEYDGDKISGYAGSAFKAGTELEFEYDSADNISAINSSAISTTPSQALYAKSPLFAGVSGTSSFIGINSADLARMLGVDETVLYSGNLSQGNKDSIPLSEPITNFEKFKVYGAWNYNNDARMYSQVEIDTVNSGLRFDLNAFGPVKTDVQQDDAYCYFTVGCYKFNTSTSIDVIDAVRFHTNLGAFSDSDTIKIYKVIGVGRKEA